MEAIKQAERIIEDSWRRVFKPMERLPFVEWCEKNIVLDSSEAPESAGPYRRGPVVTMGRLFELFLDTEAGKWRSLDIAKPSQSAATAHALMAIVRHVARGAGNVVYVIHSQEEAANISRRLQKMLEACPETQGAFEEVDDDDKSTRALRLPGMTIWITGAGSAGALASKPGVALMVGDEVDKHKQLKGEAETMELIEQRGKTVSSARMFGFSTPTTEEGQIWRRFEKGSRHRYHVPCPMCEEMQVVDHEALHFSDCKDLAGDFDLEWVRRDTKVRCQGCKGLIGQEHKRWMIEGGEWRPTNYKDLKGEGDKIEQVPGWVPGRMSAQVSDLLYFWEGSSWGDVAVEMITARNDPQKMHSFLNNRAGAPFKIGGGRNVQEADVLALRGSYERGEVPVDPAFVTFAADTQDDCWKWVLCGWGEDGTCYVADYGQTMIWKDVLQFAKRGVKFDGQEYMSKFCLVDDGGHRSYEVRRNVRGLKPWFFACKGAAGRQISSTVSWRSFRLAKDGVEEIPVLQFDDPAFKRLLYRERILDRRKHKGEEFDTPKLWLPKNVEGEFVRELCGESLERVTDKVTGAARWRWVQKPPNDFGDSLKMNYVAWAVAGEGYVRKVGSGKSEGGS